MSEVSQLLSGIRVVSLEQYISAPYCTQVLADAGAEVIKVERPESGDPRRGYEPRVRLGDDEISGGFASYNRGKLSVALDIADADDLATLRELLDTADVLVSNLRPGALARAGLDPVALRSSNPGLVVCEITGFGTSGGPSQAWPAFDSAIQAMSGLSGLIGESRDSPPLLAPMSTMDILAGTWSVIGILLGLVRRATTGEGCVVDAAMYDIGAAFLERPLTLHEFTGQVPTRGGDRFSPVGAFRAADMRWLSIVIPTDDMWRRCCLAIGRADLIDDHRVDTVLKRSDQMRDIVIPALEDWTIRDGLDADEAAERLRDAGQPVGVVQGIDEVRRSEQLKHRELFVPLLYRKGQNDENSELLLPRMPLIVDGTIARPGRVPRLGEHTEQLRSELARRSSRVSGKDI